MVPIFAIFFNLLCNFVSALIPPGDGRTDTSPAPTTPLLNQEVLKNIHHICQRYNWDCGVTCVLMTLSENNRRQFLQDFSKICEEEGFGHTTCTIDLCYLLKRYNIEHSMYTTRQSANIKSFHSCKNESKRIKKRFQNASINGITVYDGVISIAAIITHTVHKGPAIVLVDAGLLSCDLCKHNKLTSEFRRIFGGSYQGHYILVVGWSRNKIVYLDPARPQPFCATTPARLQAARLVPGTDCDVILIHTYG